MFIILTYNSHVWWSISIHPASSVFLECSGSSHTTVQLKTLNSHGPLDLGGINSLKANQWMTAWLCCVLQWSQSVSAIKSSLWLLVRTVTWTLTSNPTVILARFLRLHCEWVKNKQQALISYMAPVSHQETIVGRGSWRLLSMKSQEGRVHASASLILSRPDDLTISSLALWDNIIPAIIPGFVASWLCSTAHLVHLCLCMMRACVCTRVREETRARMSEGSSGAGCWLAEFPPSHSLIGELFGSTSGLRGFTKAYKAVLAWTIKQERVAEVVSLALIAFFFLMRKCSFMQYDTPFTFSLMNQGLAKSSVGEVMAMGEVWNARTQLCCPTETL